MTKRIGGAEKRGPPPWPMMQKRILVVDDDAMVLESIEIMLDTEGYLLERAGSGAEALQKFEPGKYDLILTDNRMSGMSGSQLVETLKSRQPTQRIMMLSGMLSSGPAPACDRILMKPFAAPDLRKAVAELLQ